MDAPDGRPPRATRSLSFWAMLIAGQAAAQPPDPSHAVGFPPPLSHGLNAPVALLPVNLVVPNSILPLARSMWLRSPTFRRQCHRLSEHPEIVVQFEFTARVERGSGRTLPAAAPRGNNGDGRNRLARPVFVRRAHRARTRARTRATGRHGPRRARATGRRRGGETKSRSLRHDARLLYRTHRRS